MFKLLEKPQWGFLVGSGAVGIPLVPTVLFTDARSAGLAWFGCLTAVLVGGGWAALLSLQKKPANLGRSACLGAYAWMAVSSLVCFLTFWFNPFVVVVVPITALLGACTGAVVGWVLQQVRSNVAKGTHGRA